VDSTENCDSGNITEVLLPEYLNPPNFPSYELKLMNNCIVMLLRNLNFAQGLCNGKGLEVLQLK